MQFRRNLLIAGGLLGLVSSISAPAAYGAPFSVDVPMEVEADRFELFLDERLAVWTGNVVATQQGSVFKSSRFTLRLVPEEEESETSATQGDTARPSDDPNFELQAGRLSYHRDRVVGSGGCVISRGPDSIAADEIAMDLRTQTMIAKPHDDGRVYVRLLLSPDLQVVSGIKKADSNYAAD